MSFVGSVGHLMNGTGLQKPLDVIFARNTFPHIIRGKAYARAVCVHFLIDAVLHTLFQSKLCGTKLTLPSQDVPSQLSGIADLYYDLMSGKVTVLIC